MLTVFILPSAPRMQAMLAAKVPLPAPVSGLFLVDTGASHTVVDQGLVAPLGLQPTGTTGVQTPSTNGVLHQCNMYDVQMIIPCGVLQAPAFVLPAIPVIESSLAPQGIMGLIGRDILQKCLLVYNGVTGDYSLSY
ncbi:aspartyl protease family protein [Paraburkholderia sp. BCC1885]|uniref:aspartyl protease family protein n=1 Tax=Paraburkholderia sp. BCC1885 TaxID=2562669 RepID=UPI001642E08A|nr:aspartyl protease family protein [Paraburkholderia sp. BCC1885]